MKSKLQLVVLLVCMAFVHAGCSKSSTGVGTKVEIYLFSTSRNELNKCKVDEANSIVRNEAFLQNDDFLQYDKTNYEFTITSSAAQKVSTLLDATPFALTVDKQIIFIGFYKPSISSSSCDHSITMDTYLGINTITFRLGYPGPLPGITINDQRNNALLLETLRAQGKLN
jgi:hypothetical protein